MKILTTKKWMALEVPLLIICMVLSMIVSPVGPGAAPVYGSSILNNSGSETVNINNIPVGTGPVFLNNAQTGQVVANISITSINGISFDMNNTSVQYASPLTVNGTVTATSYIAQMSQYHIQVDWGDGSAPDTNVTTNFIASGNGFSGPWVTQPHDYPSSGNYNVVVKLYHGRPPGSEAADASFELKNVFISDVATKLDFTAEPSGGPAGQPFSVQPQVTVQNAGGGTVTGYYGTVSMSITSGTGTSGAALSGTINIPVSNGVAIFTDLSIDKAGNGYTLTASSNSLTPGTSKPFNINVGGAAKLAFVQQPGNTAATASITPAVTVAIEDAGGNTVTASTASITLTVGNNPSSGTLAGTKTVSAINGVATFSDLSIDKTGTGYTLTASSNSLAPATSNPFNITVGPANKLAFTTQPSGGTGGVPFGTQPAVTVQDAGGNIVTTSDAPITLAIGTNPSGGTLSATANPINASSGVATFNGISVDKIGAGYTLTATSGSLSPATSNPFDITGLAPSITQQPSDEYITYGDSASFTSTASGNPSPTVQWQLSTDGGSTWNNISGAAGTTYNIPQPTVSQSGSKYRAVFSNVSGTVTSNAAALTVNPKPLSITANSTSKNYGQTVTFAGSEFTTNGLVNGDTVTSVTLTSNGAVNTAGVGSYDIVPSAAVGTGLGNYTISYQNGTLTVSAKALTITANSTSKNYGQTVTFAGSEFTTSGLVNGDAVTSVTLTSNGAAAAATVAGSPYDIVPSAAVGTGLGNYTITYSNGTLTVNQAVLTVTANNVSRVYGAANPAFTASYSGFVNGDTAEVLSGIPSLTTTATESSPVGSYTITAAQGSLTTANYSFNFVNGTLTVGQAVLTVTADAQTKVYGDTDPALTYQITNGSLVGSDAFSGALTRMAGENVGTYSIQQGTLALNSNYAFTYVGANLTVTARPITITADAQTKVYGDTDPALTYQITNGSLVGSDAFSGVLTRIAGENVGTYSIQQGTLSAGSNYNLNYIASILTITKKAASVTPDSASKAYGATDPPFTGTLNGFLTTDGVTATYNRAQGEAEGSYIISATLNPAEVLSNYDITYNTANFVINPASITVTANDISRVYGAANPAFTASYSGFVNGDTAEVLSGIPSLTTTATESSPVGSYTITAAQGSLTAANYSFNFVNGTLTVGQAVLTVTADAQTKVYGDTDPALTYQITNGSLVGSDAFSGALTRMAGENVGAYPIQQGTLSAGSNYNITFAGADLTITPAALTATAGDATRPYGATNPAFTGSIVGILNNDPITATYSCTAGTSSAVGAYPIVPAVSDGDSGKLANYNITTINGTLTVTAVSYGSGGGSVSQGPTVNITPTPTPSPVPAIPPVLTPTPEYLTVDFLGKVTKGQISSNGALINSLTAQSPDGANSLDIQQGTITLGKDGNIVKSIQITETPMPPVPGDKAGIGKAYDFEPSGTSFSKPISITLGYDVNQVPQKIQSLDVAYYTTSSGWQILENIGGSIANAGELTGQVNHFTTFAIIASKSPASFKLNNLHITPSEKVIWSFLPFVVVTGEQADLTVNVSNDGGITGSYTGELKIDGQVVSKQDLSLNPAQVGTLNFNLKALRSGHHTVEVGGLTGGIDSSLWINYWLIIGILLALGVIFWIIKRYAFRKKKA